MRGKIGPGPGAYMLPPAIGFEKHDQSLYRNPQYSMGIKLATLDKRVSPGPKYGIDNMTRVGKVSPPAYSLSYRHKELTAFKPPGPGTYSPEKVPRMKEPRPPVYTMSYRYQDLKRLNTPAPNQYPQPSTLGPKVPNMHAEAAYSMSGVRDNKMLDRSPGPAKYGETNASIYKNKPPNYTMGIKHVDLTGRVKNPGPAGYHPKLPGFAMGGYSFGQRTINEPYITADDTMLCTRRNK